MISDELLVFFGLDLHMDHISLPKIQDYWKKDTLFVNSIFSAYMGREIYDYYEMKTCRQNLQN